MSDNVAITAGSGTNIATDDVGGVQYQRVKNVFGADGVATDVSSTAPMPTTESDGDLGVGAGLTGLRDRIVAERQTTLADSMADGLAGWWTTTAANGGAIASTGGEGRLTTSVAINGSIHISSPNIPYFPGQVAWLNSAVRLDAGVAGNIRRIGMFTVSGTTPQEGFYFELNESTLNAVTVKSGTATAVASTSWTKFSTAPFTMDTNYHSFEIRYTANSVWFYVDNILRHSVSGTSASLTNSLSLPMAASNIKTSGVTDVTFAIRNIGNGRYGQQGGTVLETGLLAVEATATGGGTPHDSVDSGNPLKIGGKASTTIPTAVAEGDRVNAWFSPNGAQNVVTVQSTIPSYSAVNAAYTPPATPTDMVTIVGSATKTVAVLRVEFAATQTTAAVNTIHLVKRSAANTAGTTVAATRVPYDANDSAPTATVQHYTVNATVLGAAVGTVRTARVYTPAPATATFSTPTHVWDFETGLQKPIILRGVAQSLAVNFNGAALPAGLSVTCTIVWQEY